MGKLGKLGALGIDHAGIREVGGVVGFLGFGGVGRWGSFPCACLEEIMIVLTIATNHYFTPVPVSSDEQVSSDEDDQSPFPLNQQEPSSSSGQHIPLLKPGSLSPNSDKV